MNFRTLKYHSLKYDVRLDEVGLVYIYVQATDKWLTEKGLDVGSVWPEK